MTEEEYRLSCEQEEYDEDLIERLYSQPADDCTFICYVCRTVHFNVADVRECCIDEKQRRASGSA